MDPLIWATVLFVIGLTLAVLELFVPSGGIIGVTALLALLASVWMAFQHGPWVGLTFLAGAVLLVPACMALVFRWWPETPVGRRLLLRVPKGDEVLPDSDERRELKALVGKVGEAKSLMMPSGAIQIAGRTIDAVSVGVAIEPGQRVRVIEVRGTRVVVQPTTDEPSAADPNDPLSQPIEALGFDPFDEPLA